MTREGGPKISVVLSGFKFPHWVLTGVISAVGGVLYIHGNKTKDDVAGKFSEGRAAIVKSIKDDFEGEFEKLEGKINQIPNCSRQLEEFNVRMARVEQALKDLREFTFASRPRADASKVADDAAPKG